MANWSDLTLDIAIEIAEKIVYYEDFIMGFGGVCRNWRHAMELATAPSSSRHTPLLLLPSPPGDGGGGGGSDGDGQWYRSGHLYSLDEEQVVQHVDLPYRPFTELDDDSIDLRALFVQENWTYVSTRGWLVYVDETLHDVVLVHPLSNEIIQCPSIPYYLSQEFEDVTLFFPGYERVGFALSESPSTTSQYSLAMIYRGYHAVAVWCSTENEWLVRKFPNNKKIMDINFYRGDLYFVDLKGKVVAFATQKVINVESLWVQERWGGSTYLVESDGKLLIIRRKLTSYKDSDGIVAVTTLYFKIWEVNVDNGDTKEVTDLGNNALFLGYNSSFSIKTSICYNVWPNCIYYVGDHGYAKDMGIYDMESMEKVEDHYDPSELSSFMFPPPLWVEATSTSSLIIEN